MHPLNRLVPDSKSHHFALLLILGLSAFLNTYNINFPDFYHADEAKKFQFVLTDQQDFRHPILMLQTARVLHKVVGLKDSNRLIILCRMISASLGVLIVFLIYRLSRQGLGKNYALLAALTVAVSPILVVHAHYFKEDIIFTACSFLSLICFLKLLRERTTAATLLWGLATGLALSAQYKGIFLALLYFVFPRVLPDLDRTWFYKNFRIGLAVMASVFLLVNYPLFLNANIFFSGFTNEVSHVVGGHTLNVYPFQHWFGFHLVNSLIPGMSLIVTLLALGGLAITVRRWKEAAVVDKLLFLYTMAFYFVHEISPMKTFPDFMRYMIPIVPAMIYFACKAISKISQWMQRYPAKTMVPGVPWVLAGAVVLVPAYDSWRLDSHLIDDTRLQARQWIDAAQGETWGERYTLGKDWKKRYLTEIDISEARNSGVAYLAVSSFSYERFFIGSQWSWQNQAVYETHKKYIRLFSYPYVEIKPAYKTFAFSNPVIRIIDIRGPQKNKEPGK
jgi:4-amino-4-deoxy-L-arabinose transferase-like glycosyltransferase